jgi:hypothetical protein
MGSILSASEDFWHCAKKQAATILFRSLRRFNAKMPARKRNAVAYYVPVISLLALIHNIALSNDYCISTLFHNL